MHIHLYIKSDSILCTASISAPFKYKLKFPMTVFACFFHYCTPPHQATTDVLWEHLASLRGLPHTLYINHLCYEKVFLSLLKYDSLIRVIHNIAKKHSLPCLIASVICWKKLCVNGWSEFAVFISVTDDVATLETLETAAGTVPRKNKATTPQNSISQSISLEIS